MDDKTPIPSHMDPVTKLRVFNSADILKGEQEVNIVHNDAVYKIRVTHQGKLIMVK
jgi:hemin uptake protein HemP